MFGERPVPRRADYFERERTRLRNEQRVRRHMSASRPEPPPNQQYTCLDCGRRRGSHIGLHSHRRLHGR